MNFWGHLYLSPEVRLKTNCFDGRLDCRGKCVSFFSVIFLNAFVIDIVFVIGVVINY